MTRICVRMLTGDQVKFFGLVFGIAFSTVLITQQLAIFVNLLPRGATPVHEVATADIWIMDQSRRTPAVSPVRLGKVVSPYQPATGYLVIVDRTI